MISINATLVVQIINFLILIWILNHILFRPIFRIIEEREAFVKDRKTEAGRIEAEAVGKLKTYEDRMSMAREEALVRRVEARDEATAGAREIMYRANAEAQEHIAAIHAEAAKAVQDVKIELTDFKESIAEMVLAKIIGREVQ